MVLKAFLGSDSTPWLHCLILFGLQIPNTNIIQWIFHFNPLLCSCFKLIQFQCDLMTKISYFGSSRWRQWLRNSLCVITDPKIKLQFIWGKSCILTWRQEFPAVGVAGSNAFLLWLLSSLKQSLLTRVIGCTHSWMVFHLHLCAKAYQLRNKKIYDWSISAHLFWLNHH